MANSIVSKFKDKKIIIAGLSILVLVFSFLAFKFLKKNHVPIAMALDDGYTYPTIVSITSMMENKNRNTVYDFYVMHPGEFSDESKGKLKSLENKYSGCNINLIDMSDKYKNAYDKGHITTPTYYRLSLPDLLPNLDKIIWMDGDTLIFKDLSEMFNVDMKKYCYKGFLDYKWHLPEMDRLGLSTDNYICAGVMLINLKELRNCNAVEECNKFINENNDKISAHDQTVINAMYIDRIGVLPAKFGIFNDFNNEEEAMEYPEKYVPSSKKYSKEEMKNAFNNPTIVHCVRKPWKNLEVPFAEVWWEYAKKSDFYDQIVAFGSNF